jgi:D-beta-D-heptose 7-phosphate kinase / D-beta-D-heptose 1-phosphate adenosyltransferase
MTQTLCALERLARPRILVLGDLILDTYTWGNADRVSPEAPVLVLHIDQEEVRLGGAASVAHLAQSLQCQVSLCGVIGADAQGRVLQKLVSESSIDGSGILVDENRPTTMKERFIGRAANRHAHQILRVDREIRAPLVAELEQRLLTHVNQRIHDFQAILVSDYAKGVCTPSLLEGIIARARRSGVPVLIDPGRITDYRRYRGATVLAPNRAQTEMGTSKAVKGPDDAMAAGKKLCEELGLDAAVIKLDRDGMVLARLGVQGQWFPTRPRAVYDVTGAGDMVLAMLGLGLASGLSLEEAVPLANAAAGLEVERLGVTPVTREELQTELSRNRPSFTNKILSADRLADEVQRHRNNRKSIVFTNGCFDLLHLGHVTCLEEAAQQGDVLIVAVNSDASVKRLKGPGRPVIHQDQRAAMLAALNFVDHVTIFDGDSPIELLRRLRPDVLVKGGTTADVIGREVVEEYGGRIHVTSQVADISTTRILQCVSSL